MTLATKILSAKSRWANYQLTDGISTFLILYVDSLVSFEVIKSFKKRGRM
jgi:hypothetical protein